MPPLAVGTFSRLFAKARPFRPQTLPEDIKAPRSLRCLLSGANPKLEQGLADDWQPKSIKCHDQARFHPPHSENVKLCDRYSGANWRAVRRCGWRDGLPEATRRDGATCQGTYAPISFIDAAEASTRSVYCIIASAKGPYVASADKAAKWFRALFRQICFGKACA
jgi:hypothetical protein